MGTYNLYWYGANISKNAAKTTFCNHHTAGGCARVKAARAQPQCLCGVWVKATAPVMARPYAGGHWAVGQLCPKCITTRMPQYRWLPVTTCNCCGKLVSKRRIVAYLGLPIPLAIAQKSKNPNILKALAKYFTNKAKWG